MSIVLKQSFKNTLIIYLAFVFGGINTLFLYTGFLKEEYYGLVTFLLSTANLLMPLTAFGIHFTIVKFYSSYHDKVERDKFLSMALIVPLFIAIPIGFIGNLFYEAISNWLARKNDLVKDYTLIIYLIAIATAYFEIFYAWSKVQLKSVFGNFIKEMYNRVVVMILLFAVYFEFITKPQFIYVLTGAYFIRLLIMMLYAFKTYFPKISFSFPSNYKEILKYSGYIILAGSAGAILIDIDKFMLPGKKEIELVAYYTVAVFIGSALEAPGRAMAQILQPLTSKALNEGDMTEVNKLYKKSSINLALITGLFFLLVNLNIDDLFLLMPDSEKYAGGALVVLMISAAKLYTMFLGSNGAIISNSKHYRVLLPYGIAMAASLIYLNDILIDKIGMNGAALSTLLVILFFNTLKVWYVKRKFSIQPFTVKTLWMFLILLAFYGLFYFIHLPFHPLVNIVVKSILISVSYFLIVKWLRISEDINKLIYRFLKF